MPSHTVHEDIAEAGLNDDCERCAEIATNPVVYLDGENFRALWAKMISVEFDDQGGYRSDNERTAGKQLYTIALFVERHTILDPRDAVTSEGILT